MCVNWQEQTTTASVETIVANVVIRKRCIVIPDQQTVLIWEVLNPIGLGVGKAEIVRAGEQAIIIAQIGAEFRKVGVEERLGDCAGGTAESGIGPTRLGLSTIGGQAGNGNLIHTEASFGNRTIGPVAEAESDSLTGISRKVSG